MIQQRFRNEWKTIAKIRIYITLENELGLVLLLKEKWQQFIEKILSSMEDLNFKTDDEADLEKKLITNFPENVKTCKNSAGIFIIFVQVLLKNWFSVVLRIL